MKEEHFCIIQPPPAHVRYNTRFLFLHGKERKNRLIGLLAKGSRRTIFSDLRHNALFGITLRVSRQQQQYKSMVYGGRMTFRLMFAVENEISQAGVGGFRGANTEGY